MEHLQQRQAQGPYLHNADPYDASLRPSARPLSDIREITEPNLLEPTPRPSTEPSVPPLRLSRTRSTRRDETPVQTLKIPTHPPSQQSRHRSPIRSTDGSEDRSSVFSIPVGSVPPRSSSQPANNRSVSGQRKRSASIPREPAVLFPLPKGPFHCVSNNGQAQSPVKDAIRRMNLTESARPSRMPSKTIVKTENPSTEHILEHPILQHPRLKVDLLVAAPLFVGGSSVEGVVRIVVDEAERVRHKKTLTLERVSIDLIGLEEVLQPSHKRKTFLALGNELIGTGNPPPGDMVESTQPIALQERSWILVPSISTLPFLIKLPLNVGPPPFRSKVARIRYILCATLIIKDAGRQLSVRCSQETALLSVQDPERALVSLPSPLTASEVAIISRSRQESITVTAGLHRQVWVSGTNLFADVHILNDSHKTVKKLELRLERIVLCYNHAAAATLESSASGARMFDQKEREIIIKTTVKPGLEGWNGVLPFTAVLRTCGIEVPRGHASITCHCFFEVRYYLYISAFTTRTRVATVQLPIQIIHMNSLDVPTNSVAQVAAAIEERRGGRGASQTRIGGPRLARHPSKMSLQGRAFAAPRMQSLDRARALHDNLEDLGNQIDGNTFPNSISEHEQIIRKVGSTYSFRTPPSNRKGRIFGAADADEIGRRLQHMRQGSLDSTRTNRSFFRGKTSARQSPVLGFYMQETENGKPSSSHDVFGSRKTSLDVRPSLDRRRQQSAAIDVPGTGRDKGKGRLLDW